MLDSPPSNPVSGGARDLPGEDGRPANVFRVRPVALVAAVLCMVGGVALYLVFVRTTRGQLFDQAASIGARRRNFTPDGYTKSRTLERTEWLLDSVRSVFLAAVALAVTVVGIHARRARLTAALGVGVLVSIGTARLIKVGLPMRSHVSGNGYRWLSENTFPSGHAAASMAVALAAVALYRSTRNQWSLLTIPYAFAIGTATVVARWHQPSDVLASYLLVGACTFVALGLSASTEDRFVVDRRQWQLLFGSLSLACAALAATGYGLFRADPLDLAVRVTDGVPEWVLVPLSPGKAFAVFAFSSTAMCAVLTVVVMSLSPGRSNGPNSGIGPKTDNRARLGHYR